MNQADAHDLLNNWKLAIITTCNAKVNGLIRAAGPDEILDFADAAPAMPVGGIVTSSYATAELPNQSGYVTVSLEAGETRAIELHPDLKSETLDAKLRQSILTPEYIDRVLAHVDYSGDRMRAMGALYSLLAAALSKDVLFQHMSVSTSHMLNKPSAQITISGTYKLTSEDVPAEYGQLNFPHGYHVPIKITYAGHTG